MREMREMFEMRRVCAVCVAFCGWGHTALSRYQTVLAHAFPQGVTRIARQSAATTPSCEVRSKDPEPALSP